MSTPKGYSTQEKDDRLSAQFSTVEPIREEQFGLSVLSHQFVYEVGTDAAEAGSTAYSIVATGHVALKGDVIQITSGALSGREVRVWEVSANLITLAETLSSAIAAAVTFKILRHKYPSVDSTGAVNVNAVIVEEALSPDGGALPAQLKVMGGYDGAAVQVIKTDAAGELQVDVLSSALPSGAATSAIQTDGSQKTQIVDGSGNVIGSTGNALDVNLKTPITVDVQLSQANDSVAVFGSDGAVNRALKTDPNGELQIDVLSSALPSGASTEATLSTLNGKVTACNTGAVVISSSALPSGAATETTLAAVKTSVELIDDCVGTDGAAAPTKAMVIAGVTSGGVQQTVEVNASGHVHVADGGGSLTVDATSWPLPTGAATETTLSTLNGKVPSNLTVSSTRLLVDGSGVTQPVSIAATVITQDTGRSVRNRARNDYTSTSVTTGAYVQLLASTSGTVNEIEIFDSSGQTLVLATGGLGSEVDHVYVFPGGNGRIPLAIGSGVRVSIKAVSATANSGEIAINFYS